MMVMMLPVIIHVILMIGLRPDHSVLWLPKLVVKTEQPKFNFIFLPAAVASPPHPGPPRPLTSPRHSPPHSRLRPPPSSPIVAPAAAHVFAYSGTPGNNRWQAPAVSSTK